jgi:hypothetical protein
MIHKHKLESLTEDEMSLLLYCLNESKCGETIIDTDNIKCIRTKFVYTTLNEHAQTIKEEHRHILQGIVDKIVG